MVTVPNTVDTELIAYFTDCKNYSQNSELKLWLTNVNKYQLLAALSQDLLSAKCILCIRGTRTCVLSLWDWTADDSKQEKSAD